MGGIKAVGPAGVAQRIAHIHSAILRATEERGYPFSPDKGHREPTAVIIKGQRVSWRLREKYQYRRVPPSTSKVQKASTPEPALNQELMPTGYLILTIEANYSSDREIVERARRPLELRIAEIIARFEAAADNANERAAYWEDFQRRHREQAERQRRRERLEAREDARWSDLRQAASDWNEAERLRAFVGVAERRMAELDRRPPRVDLWLRWAHERIAALDPFACDAQAVYDTVIRNADLAGEACAQIDEYSDDVV